MAAETYDVVTLVSANLKLPYANVTLPVGGEKTIYIVAGNTDYAFDDITDIVTKESPTALTFQKENNQSFTISGVTATTIPEVVTIQVKKGTDHVDLTLNVTVEEEDTTVLADFHKSMFDMVPNQTVEFRLEGGESADAMIDQVVDTSSPLQIDTVARTLFCSQEGTFANAIVVSKDGKTRTIYVQAEVKHIVKVDPNEVTLHTEETKTVDVKLVGDSYTFISEAPDVFTAEKATRKIIPAMVGRGNLVVTGVRGSLEQRVLVPVTVRNVVLPSKPKLTSQLTSVVGGGVLNLTFNIGNTDTLHAEIMMPDMSSGSEEKVPAIEKGTVKVQDRIVFYTSHRPENAEEVFIRVRSRSEDGVDSDPTDVRVAVTGIPKTTLTVPERISLKESDVLDISDLIQSNAKNVQLTSSLPNIATVNSSKLTVRGIKYGTCRIFVNAEAIDHLPAQAEIAVTVDPADVDKPVISTSVLRVLEEDVIKIPFILPEGCALQVTDLSNRGTTVIKENVLEWTAPLNTNDEDVQMYKLQAVSFREEVNKSSGLYEFQIAVITKPKADAPDEEEKFDGISIGEVKHVIRDNTLTFQEKIGVILKQADSETQDIVRKLVDYADTMSEKNSENTDEFAFYGASKHYELFMIMKRIVETKDNDKFQTWFDILNQVFREYRKDAYSSVNLHRFDDSWAGGDKNLYSFQNLSACIATLCNVVTRTTGLKRVDFDMVFDLDKTVFKDDTKQSVIKYYTM